jgi:hypothetical protein
MPDFFLRVSWRGMRFKWILLSSIVLVIGLVIVSSSAAGACGPVDFDASAETIWCDARARIPTPPPPPTHPPVLVAAVKPVAVTTQRSGDSPANAMEVGEDSQMINPNARLWYKIGSDGSHIDVWMTTYGQPGLGFAVYAPNQDIYAPESKPKGVGTYPNTDPNTLRWSGGSWTQRGVWYALVTNTSDKSLSFKLSSNQSLVNHNCNSYWETLPSGVYVYWTACN